ncbi:MAG: DUF5131 family protein [Bacteroides sp.]|nr:DUF5131 family protein [Bacteroides sp.]
MNKSKNNVYEFVTHTWNPIKGLCEYQCVYCYMVGMFQRFKLNTAIRSDIKALNQNLGKKNFIFVGSSIDMWSPAVDSEWIVKSLDHCYNYKENKYLFQSKSPKRFPDFLQHPLMANKDNLIFATTLETNEDISLYSKAASIEERISPMVKIRSLGYDVMVTLEPVMQFDFAKLIMLLRSIAPFQVNIGCNSNKSVKLKQPTKDQLTVLIKELETFTHVHLKGNAARILGDLSKI